MYERAERAHKRFVTNLTRIQSLFDVAFTRSSSFDPAGAVAMESVSGDLMRAIVVFLHASTEDYIRTNLRPNYKFTFSGEADVEKACVRHSFDSASLASFLPHLTSLAKRRNHIVHHADLSDSGTVTEWTIVDTCDVFIWLTAIWGFSWQLMSIVTQPHPNFVERGSAFRSAMQRAVDFKKEMEKFASSPSTYTPARKVEMDQRLVEIFATAHPKQKAPTSFRVP